MNYEKHYYSLIERAKDRRLNCYIESHHIVPRCLGGSNENDNLVELTPEEHYVAHQLLVKMYPKHKGLVWAALQMTGHGNGERSNNKLYGWLRRKYQRVAKQRTGKKNGSYGKKWYYNPETLDNIKCLEEEVPEGYIKGRKLKPYNTCKVCGKNITGSVLANYCNEHRKELQTKQIKKNGLAIEKYTEDDIIDAVKQCKNKREVCLYLGIMKIGGRDYTKITDVMKRNNLEFDK